MGETLPSSADLKRKVLFTPCDNMEALHRWIKVYLNIDMPMGRVDPSSTSSPMEMIWEIYNAARLNNRIDMSQVLAYAARDSFKTLGASVLEVLMLVHLRRPVAHMAAIESQASKSQQYIKKFLNKPILRDYIVSKNERKVEIAFYEHLKTKEILAPKEWAVLSQQEKDEYEEIRNYISIIICTVAGANSEHVPFLVVDEVDVVSNPDAYEESKMIPAPAGENLAITLLTSTRKYSFGLVQKEIDKKDESGLQIRHWNIIDVTERCPESRHRPDKKKLPIYYSDETLKAMGKDGYDSLTPEQKSKYKCEEGYAGCLENCKIYAACRGRLAEAKDRPFASAGLRTSKMVMLKQIDHVIAQFRKTSLAKALAQLLCRKPSTEGLIYPNFDRSTHVITAATIAHMITGEEYKKDLTKVELIQIAKEHGCKFVSGMDFGFTHNFAVVTAIIHGSYAFVIDVIARPELELSQKIDVCDKQIKDFNPDIFADTAYPSDIKTFKRNGYRMRDWSKEKDSVSGGIEVVRMKFMPAIGKPELFFLAGDEGVNLLSDRVSMYHWKLDAAGRPTDVPDDEDDDECDALRYLIMNIFKTKNKPAIAQETPQPLPMPQMTPQNWMKNAIAQHLGETDTDIVVTGSAKGRKGGLSWSFG